ncbi:MAG: ASKHA domain-containing protein [Phycisphaerae bacterium]
MTLPIRSHILQVEQHDTPTRAITLTAADDHQVLSTVLHDHGIPLNTRCGGRGLCDACTVEILSGPHTSSAIKACLVKLCDLPSAATTHIRIPTRSSLRYRPQIVTEWRVNIPCGHDPLYVPTREETTPLGVAVDIGTTTVAILLVDLRTGRVLTQAAQFNEQMKLGDDVVTRINLCLTDPTMLVRLQQAIIEATLYPLLRSALAQLDASLNQVRCFTIAGNTTMLHLLAGVNPGPMGMAPFTPVFLAHRVLPAQELFPALLLPTTVQVHLLPSASAYVGADLTAGVVASGMYYDEGPSLLVDVGTNGEMVLKHQGQFWGCATAAGPAFEGAGLYCGMRAGTGAISDISLAGEGDSFSVSTQVIGPAHTVAVGLCGSAYVDFLAQGRAVGLLGAQGRFHDKFNAAGHVIPWEKGLDKAFNLGPVTDAHPVVISQRDIASLLQAKAAIAAGILTLLNQAGITPAEIKTLYLAGGFGTKMNVAHALACGLLPGFTVAQIQPVGNTALAGAYLALLDQSLLTEMKHVGEQMRIVELNHDPNFEDTYIDQLSLP